MTYDTVLMPFGMYQGWKLSDIPINYLFWLAEEAAVPPGLRNAVELVLQQRLAQRDAEGESRMSKDDYKRLRVYSCQDIAIWWEYYAKWFKNEFYGFQLQKPTFEIKRSRRWMGYWNPKLRILGFNNNYILPQDRFENILIHEMCHQYITEKNIEDTSSHGKRWRNIAARMSYSTGNKITICDDEAYAPNHHISDGTMLILPERKTQGKTRIVSVEQAEKMYGDFKEELSNM